MPVHNRLSSNASIFNNCIASVSKTNQINSTIFEHFNTDYARVSF